MKLKRGDPVWYRLLVRVPFVVEFERSAWKFEEPALASGRPDHWELIASDIGDGGHWVLSEKFSRLDWLNQALYVDGFASRHLSAAETILDRAVTLGKAERLEAPLRPPEAGRGWPWNWP